MSLYQYQCQSKLNYNKKKTSCKIDATFKYFYDNDIMWRKNNTNLFIWLWYLIYDE